MNSAALAVLKGLRLSPQANEYQVQDEIERALQMGGIHFHREYKLGSGSRIDFLLEDGTGIEVKNKKPNSKALATQVERYCGYDMVTGVIVVVATSAFDLDSEVNGKPVEYIALNQQWGMTV